jgi:hypothetical protein
VIVAFYFISECSVSFYLLSFLVIFSLLVNSTNSTVVSKLLLLHLATPTVPAMTLALDIAYDFREGR